MEQLITGGPVKWGPLRLAFLTSTNLLSFGSTHCRSRAKSQDCGGKVYLEANGGNGDGGTVHV